MTDISDELRFKAIHDEYLKHYELNILISNDIRKLRQKGYLALLILLILILISPKEINFEYFVLTLSQGWGLSLVRIAITAIIVGIFWEITAKESYINVRYQYINHLLETLKPDIPEIKKVVPLLGDQNPMMSILQTRNWSFPISDLSVPIFLLGYGIILFTNDLLASIALLFSSIITILIFFVYNQAASNKYNADNRDSKT